MFHQRVDLWWHFGSTAAIVCVCGGLLLLVQVTIAMASAILDKDLVMVFIEKVFPPASNDAGDEDEE